MRIANARRLLHAAGVAAWLTLVGHPALAVDGVIEINQARALAGGVVPGDAPDFPVTINTGGSFRLTGNLSLNAGLLNVSAIFVTTSNGVTIDLNGFALQGPGSCGIDGCVTPGTSRGIDGSGSPSVTVRNGIVRGFPSGGVSLGARARVEDVTATNNGGIGIQVDANSVISGCIAGSNAGNGIQTSSANTLAGNTADNNGQNGIQTSQSSSLSHNTAASNKGTGIAASTSCTLDGNTVRLNLGNGISCVNCVLIGNTAFANTQFGFSLDANSGYTQSNLRDNHGGNDQTQVAGGVDQGQNLCGVPIACP